MANGPAFQGRCVLYKVARSPACALDTPPLAVSKKQQWCLSLGTSATWVRERQEKKMQLANIISSNTFSMSPLLLSPQLHKILAYQAMHAFFSFLLLPVFFSIFLMTPSRCWHSQIWKVAGRSLLLVLILPAPFSQMICPSVPPL